MLKYLLTEKYVEIILIKTPVIITAAPRSSNRFVFSNVNIRKNFFSIRYSNPIKRVSAINAAIKPNNAL